MSYPDDVGAQAWQAWEQTQQEELNKQTTHEQQQAAIQAEIARRQAVWQAITASGPVAVQYICNWALEQGHATEHQLRLWYAYESGELTIEIQSCQIALNLAGQVEFRRRPSHSVPGFPPAGPAVPGRRPPRPWNVPSGLPSGFPASAKKAPDPYGDLPNLSDTAPEEFMQSAISTLVQSLQEALQAMREEGLA